VWSYDIKHKKKTHKINQTKNPEAQTVQMKVVY